MPRRFTGRALEALERAAAEATRSKVGSITPEHLLLGILQDRDSIGTTALKGLGIDLDLLADELGRVTDSDSSVAAGSNDLTPRAQRVVELAHEVLSSFTPSHTYIGTEHLVLGLMREGTSAAAGLLRSHGLDEPGMLAEVQRMLGPASAEHFEQAMAKAQQLAKERNAGDLSSSASTCQVCEANPAVLHLTQVKNKEMVEVHLCERCGKDLGFGLL